MKAAGAVGFTAGEGAREWSKPPRSWVRRGQFHAIGAQVLPAYRMHQLAFADWQQATAAAAHYLPTQR